MAKAKKSERHYPVMTEEEWLHDLGRIKDKLNDLMVFGEHTTEVDDYLVKAEDDLEAAKHLFKEVGNKKRRTD
jgi:hypothetical protein